MNNNQVYNFQQKREIFTVNLKRIDRENQFDQQRKKILSENQARQLEVEINLRELEKMLIQNNRVGIKRCLKNLIDLFTINSKHQYTAITYLNTLIQINEQEDNSSIHNDALILLVRLSLDDLVNGKIYEALQPLINLVNYYMHYISTSIGNQLIEKALVIIGNLACQDEILKFMNVQQVQTLLILAECGNKTLMELTLWILTNMLYSSHYDSQCLRQLVKLITGSGLPLFMADLLTKQTTLSLKKYIYWIFFEMSLFYNQEWVEFNVSQEQSEQLQLIILAYYANMTSQQVVPFNCNINLLLKLYESSNSDNIRREILIIMTNLVLLVKLDSSIVYQLIFRAMPKYQVDSVYLLFNSMQCMQMELQTQEDRLLLFATLQVPELDQNVKNQLLLFFKYNQQEEQID